MSAGIYMTGDNIVDIIEYHVTDRHFSIYKIQHYRSRIDNQLGAVSGAKASKATVFALHETMITLTILAVDDPGNDFVIAHKTMIGQHPKAFEWLYTAMQTSLDLLGKGDWNKLDELCDSLVKRHSDSAKNRAIVGRSQPKVKRPDLPFG